MVLNGGSPGHKLRNMLGTDDDMIAAALALGGSLVTRKKWA